MKKLKTNEEKIAAFKKANKVRREKLLKEAGFKDSASYIAHLQGTPNTLPKKESKAKTKKETSTPSQEGSPIDVVIAFDTTGSMSSYIASVRKRVEETIGEMFSNTPNLRMKIVAFGDYCDMDSATKFGRAYQETELTDNQNALISFVKGSKDTGGGDSDEFYELVIKKIVEETPWREGKRSVILIGDCDPHPVGYSCPGRVDRAQIDWKQEAKKAASLGIQFDTFKIREYAEWYNELSKITGGVCMNFKSSNKVSEVIKASTYVRGGEKSRALFSMSFAAAEKSGDEELIGVYKSLSSLL